MRPQQEESTLTITTTIQETDEGVRREWSEAWWDLGSGRR